MYKDVIKIALGRVTSHLDKSQNAKRTLGSREPANRFFRSNRISNRIGRRIRFQIESLIRIELLITPIILTII